MNASIPRTVKSSSSAAPPSLLSGLPPPPALPPPGRQPAPKSQSRSLQQLSQPPPPQQYHHQQLQQYRQQHPVQGHPPPLNHAVRKPLNANDFTRPSQINNFQNNPSMVLQTPPHPLPPLNDAQKTTLRHLDTLVEVVTKKVAEQMEQNKLLNMRFTDRSGGDGMGNVNKRKKETQQQQQQQLLLPPPGIDSVSTRFNEFLFLP